MENEIDLLSNNKATAARLRKMAAVFEAAQLPLVSPYEATFVGTKEELVALIRAIGGKFTKYADTGEYANITFTSKSIKGFRIIISRDKVCRKVVSYECEPIMSPAEEEELTDEVVG